MKKSSNFKLLHLKSKLCVAIIHADILLTALIIFVGNKCEREKRLRSVADDHRGGGNHAVTRNLGESSGATASAGYEVCSFALT